MPTFEYEALDLSGRSKRGVVTAESARRARSELRRLRLTPVSINAASKSKRKLLGGDVKEPRIGQGALVAVTRQLSVLLGAGTPLEEALSAIALQADNTAIRARLLSVRERVTEGWRFADALAEDPKSFSDLYRAVVAAGETSGDLAPVLERLATMLEKNRSMKNKAIGSLIYPLALVFFAGGVVTALMTMVVPRIVEQFEAFDAQLPLVTRIVVGVSNFLGAYGLYILLGLILAGVGFWQAMKHPAIKRTVDKSLLGAPVAGGLLRGLDGARFARTLSTLVAGGAPLLDSLSGARRTVANSYIRERLEGAVTMVREGASLGAAFKRANVLPPMMLHMVAAGERAGEVPLLLDKSADQLEEEFDTASTVAMRLLEPSIIFVMGGVVAMIVVSIMLPMLQLNRLAAG
ncbi:MAG: type II secretion system inner membrane protein GspF [Pseudomonadota bacterium]